MKYTGVADKPAAPTTADIQKREVTLNAVTDCEYSIDGVNWQDSPTFTNLTPGKEYTFYQRVKRTNTVLESEASTANFTTLAIIYTLGDVNADGVIDSDDAVLALQFADTALNLTPTEEQFLAADVNLDSQLNVSDALLILQYVVDYIDGFAG